MKDLYTKDLFQAVHNNDTNAITAALNAGANIEAKSNNGKKALDLAKGNSQEILQAASDLFKAFESNDTSEIHKAITQVKGAHIDAKNNNGRTALHLAAEKGMNNIVRLLLLPDICAFKTFAEINVNINAKDINDNTALHLAVENQKLDIIEFLLVHGADVKAKNSSGNTALHLAVKNQSEEIVKTLLESGVDIDAKNSEGKTALDLATGDIERMLKYTSDLFQAARDNDTNAIKAAVKNGAIIEAKNQHGNTAVDVVASEADKKMLSATSKLFEAVSWNDTDKIKTAIKDGAIIEALNWEGETPLDLARGSTKNFIRGIKYKLNYILPTIAILGFTASMITGIATGIYSYLNFKNFKLLLNSNILYIMGSLIGLSLLTLIPMHKFGIIKLPKIPMPKFGIIKHQIVGHLFLTRPTDRTGKSPTPY